VRENSRNSPFFFPWPCATATAVGQVLLRREGVQVNHKRTYCVYRELGLQLRAKTPKRRVRAKLREDRCPAVKPNQTLAMDFVHDQLALGRKMRVLTIVDNLLEVLTSD